MHRIKRRLKILNSLSKDDFKSLAEIAYKLNLSKLDVSNDLQALIATRKVVKVKIESICGYKLK